MKVHRKRGITDHLMMNAVGYLAILAVTILGIQLLDSSINRTIGVILLVLFTILFALIPHRETIPLRIHIHLGVMTLIVAALMALRPAWSVFPMLFFVMAPTAMMALPVRKGMLWIVIFTAVTGIVFFFLASPLDAIISLLPFSAGFWFFGTFGRALVTAEEARNESQRLLIELQEAHRQLQDYTSRVEELAVSEERNRLSREMHDTLGHRLTVSAVQLEGAQRLIPSDPNRAVHMVDTVREQVSDALSELRRTVATLREPLEADLSLITALNRLVRDFQAATNLNIHLVSPDELPQLPHAYRLTLYRTTQEALTNVQKHAQANTVWLTLEYSSDTVSLVVLDDGRGYPEKVQGTAFGLMGMRERVAHLGGKLRLGEGIAGGAELRLSLPLPKEINGY